VVAVLEADGLVLDVQVRREARARRVVGDVVREGEAVVADPDREALERARVLDERVGEADVDLLGVGWGGVAWERRVRIEVGESMEKGESKEIVLWQTCFGKSRWRFWGGPIEPRAVSERPARRPQAPGGANRA